MSTTLRSSLAATAATVALTGATLVATAAAAPAAQAGASCAGSQSRSHNHTVFVVHHPDPPIRLDANAVRVVWWQTHFWPAMPWGKTWHYTTLTCFT